MNTLASSATETVLVTGAIDGLGHELAREFARRGHDLVLVAPIEPDLIDAASRIHSEFNVNVRPVALDLRGETAADELFAQLTAAGVNIDILVNSPGLGPRARLENVPVKDDIALLHQNLESTRQVVTRFLFPMVTRGRGRILNAASIASCESGAELVLYHEIEAAVREWSESLLAELRDTGVTITTLCAGRFDAAFFTESARTRQEIATKACDALMNGEPLLELCQVTKLATDQPSSPKTDAAPAPAVVAAPEAAPAPKPEVPAFREEPAMATTAAA